ncbi:MAG: hypothetical protein Q9226_006456, partial [Calogaya cf. arnoldii]
MLVLPIPWLWDLRLACTKKLALIGLFMLGCLLVNSIIPLSIANDFAVYASHVSFGSRSLLSSGRQMLHVSTQATSQNQGSRLTHSGTLVPAGVWIVVECNIGIASVCLPLMRPLISLDLSTLISHLSFSKSRRTASPFTDEEANSSDLPTLGKHCNEKPYDVPCPELTQPGHRYRHISQCQNPPSKPIHGRDHRDVRTHRSRIENYTSEMFDSVTLRKSKPSSTAKVDLVLEERVKSSPIDPPRQFLHSSTVPRDLKRKTYPTAMPLSMNPPPPKRRPSSTDQTSRRAHPLSMNPPPLKPNPSAKEQKNLKPTRAAPLSMNPPPQKSKPQPSFTSKGLPPSTTAKSHSTTLPPLQSQSSSTSTAKPNPPPPRSKSNRAFHPATAPLAPPKAHTNRKPHRLPEEEMNERYARWYQGRGSEIGKGFWGLEIVPPGGGVKAGSGDANVGGEIVAGNEEGNGEQSKTREIEESIGKEGKDRG